MVKKILLGSGVLIVLVALVGGVFVSTKLSAFDESMAKQYDVPLTEVKIPTDPEALARGKHLTESLGACVACHGSNFSGGKEEQIGPIATLKYPNITSGKNGRLASYTDAELVRLFKHGIRKDGTSLRFMPAQDFAWWPMEDIAALIAYLRSLPPVDGAPGVVEVKPLGKVLDRLDKFTLDVARRIDHTRSVEATKPAPSVQYGGYLIELCHGCHGKGLSGGPIPGAPPDLPVPRNLTPHETGLKGWTYEDFEKALRQGIRKDGTKINPFMPIDTTKNFDDNEMRGLFAYLQTVPATPFGQR